MSDRPRTYAEIYLEEAGKTAAQALTVSYFAGPAAVICTVFCLLAFRISLGASILLSLVALVAWGAFFGCMAWWLIWRVRK